MRRFRVIFLFVTILLLSTSVFGQDKSACGDVNSDGNLDISDLAYMIAWLYQGGAAPPDPSAAEMDLCNGIDIADIDYLLNYLYRGGPAPCAGGADCTLYPGGAVSLDHVNGQISPGVISTGMPITFYLRLTNNTGATITSISNGVRIYSPDGTVWAATTADTITNPGFELMMLEQIYGPPGDGDDTVGLAGMDIVGGMPDGYDNVVYKITVGPFAAGDVGKTICLDSTFYGVGGSWKWVHNGQTRFVPAWGGPYCFTIAEPSPTSISLVGVIGGLGPDSIRTNVPVTFHLNYSNNSGNNILGWTNGYRVYSPDGAEWGATVGDTTGAVDGTMFDLVHNIGYFSVTGNGADTVGFGGVILFGPGVPDGFNDVPYTITIGPIDGAYDGQTICLDSSWFPPSGVWKWAIGPSFIEYPTWSGPHCFTIADVDPPIFMQVSPDTLEFAAVVGEGNPSPQAFVVAEESGYPISYEATVSGPAEFIDLDDSVGVTPGEVIVHIDISGIDVGVYYKSVMFTSPEAVNTPQWGIVKLTVVDEWSTAIVLDHVDGLYEAGAISAGQPVLFHLRVVNYSGHNFGGIYNGFRVFSPNGAGWTQTSPGLTGTLGPAQFELGFWVSQYSADGSGADSVSFGGVSVSDGLPDGFNDIAYTIEIGPIDPVYEGKTICLDSSYILPAGAWKWSSNAYGNTNPDWDGPHCFQIAGVMPGVGDSLIVPSVAFGPGNMVQPVHVKLTQPIKGASIPVKIPAGVEIDSLSRVGLLTESWDYAFSYIKPDSGFLYVALANSSGATIPTGEHAVFNIHFRALNAECGVPSLIHWDTALSNDPIRSLLFADINGQDLLAAFDRDRDVSEVPPYVPGDQDGNGVIDIADLVFMVDYMFNGGPPPAIMNVIDVNGSCTGPNIADLVYFVDYMFIEGQPPVCGCLGAGGPKISINEAITIGAVYENGVTTIILESPQVLRGLEVELVGETEAEPVNLVADRLDMVYGFVDNRLRIGLLDLDGGETIGVGDIKVVEIPGQWEIASALVAADGRRAQSVRVNNAIKSATIPSTYALHQNHPNPFNPQTQIDFSLPVAGFVKLEVYNVMGQKVAVLVDGQLEAGVHTATFDGRSTASGVYFYRLSTDGFTQSRKMILLK